jgi:hypothetical protein
MVNLHLKRSTWTLVGGLVAAGVVLAAGSMNANRLQEIALQAGICDMPVPTKEDLEAMAKTKPFDADAYLAEQIKKKTAYDKAALARWLAAGNKSTGNPEVDALLAESDDGKAEANRIADCRAKVGKVPDDAAISRSKRWPMQAAAVIAILGALPWAWYFLLRRIAELRAAFGGNPPSR